jgi:hypothetical protein
LSPGQKVQPKRSTRISPGRVQLFLQFDIERASAEASAVHRAKHLDVPYGIEPEALGDALSHNRQQLSHPFFRVRRIDEVEVALFDTGEIRHQALIDAMRVDDDPSSDWLQQAG